MKIELLADHPEASATIARWHFEMWGHLSPDFTFDTFFQESKQSQNRDKVPMGIIALEDNNIIGVVVLKIREMEIFPDLEHWLGGVFVTPQARGRNVARTLCERAIKAARELGIQDLYLQTKYIDDGGLYGRLGWKPLEIVYSGGRDVLVMKKEL